jgi:hypothetical protein
MKYLIQITYEDLYDDITRKWYHNNQLHREDGPAVEYGSVMLQSKSFNHFCPYYLNGKQLTWDEALFNIVPKEKKPVKSLTYNVDED